MWRGRDEDDHSIIMEQVERRIYSGAVLEREFYIASGSGSRSCETRPRFKDEEDRKKHRDAVARRRHTRLVNENFSPTSLYSTLTFNDENECHSYKEARVLRNRFYDRLKYRYPDAVIFMYMGRGKNTKRIHFHMLTEGVPEAFVRQQWTYGDVVDISHLKAHNYYPDGTGGMVDHGRDYTALANYLFSHWDPEQAAVCKQRYKKSKNAHQPEKEDPKPVRRTYTPEKPPRTPKGYKLVEVTHTRYGYIDFIYVIDQELQDDLPGNWRGYRSPDDDVFIRTAV